MSAGARNCPFLILIGAAGFRGGNDDIRLPGEKRRNLEHVGNLGNRRRLSRVVDVGEDRNAEPLLDRRRGSQALVQCPVLETS